MNMHAAHPMGEPGSKKRILGVAVASLGWDQAIALLLRRIVERRFTKVAFLNAHNANIACIDAAFAGALEGFLVLPDGVGVDIAARILHGASFPANLNGTDFVPALLRASQRPLNVALLGAAPRIAEVAAGRLAQIAPQHRFEVIADGFFSVEGEADILRRIAAMRPDILLVAMGSPRQELWIDRHLDTDHCTLPIAVGALLDFLSGTVPRAPLWMRRLRLEWVFRLSLEPRRLWRRYVVGNPLFICRVVRQKIFGFPSRQGDER